MEQPVVEEMIDADCGAPAVSSMVVMSTSAACKRPRVRRLVPVVEACSEGIDGRFIDLVVNLRLIGDYCVVVAVP